MRKAADVMLVAGEASGDMHAAKLVEALRMLLPQARYYGMGAGAMRAAGVEILVDSSALAVVGLVEVLAHYREIKVALSTLQSVIRTRKPDLLILIDYPDFNLRLAATAKQAGIKVLYYVSPQVWAWRPGRVKKISRVVDMMAVVFALEVPLYEKAGVPVSFVGHPLVDEAKPSLTPAQSLARFAITPEAEVIGLFPGSRRSEIKRLMPVITQTAKLLRTRFPRAQFILPVAPGLNRKLIDTYLDDTAPAMVLVEKANIYDVIQICDAIIAKSGTVTLQIALMTTPMVIIYKVSRLSYWIARHLVSVKQIGLANIVAGMRVAKELIQNEATPQAIAAEITCLITDKEYARSMRHDMARVRAALGEGGGSQKVALLVKDMLTV